MSQWWQQTKLKIKEIAIWCAVALQKENNYEKNRLLKTLTHLQQNTLENFIEIEQIKSKISEIEVKVANGYRIRSKIKDYVEGEKSTKFFYGQEKKKGKEKLCTVIEDENGDKQYGIDNILEVQMNFYKKLYTSEGIVKT